ncbi:hypothetical protein V8B97DRAFT_1949170 [Scleroderma yunnanense]
MSFRWGHGRLSCMAVPLELLRRDEMKGFDRFEPQSFYDAMTAYGHPASIKKFDRSAQFDAPFFIWTADGFLDPHVISGVTKQSGPLSH